MFHKSLFTWFVAMMVLVAPVAAQTKSGSETAPKAGSSPAKPTQGKSSQGGGAIQTNDGRNKTSAGEQRESFQPSLKISNLNLVEGPKDTSGPSKTLVVAWNIILNRFDGVLTNKVNSQEIELLIQKSKSGSNTTR